MKPRRARRTRWCHTFGIIIDVGDRRDKSVAFAGQRLDEARLFYRIRQRFPEMIDDLVQAAIEVDEGIRLPQPARQFFAGEEFACVLEQRQQQLEGLIAERCSTPVMAQFACTRIKGEHPEMVDPGLDAISHRRGRRARPSVAAGTKISPRNETRHEVMSSHG